MIPVLTDGEYMVLLLSEIAYPAASPVGALVDEIWELYADKVLIHPMLRYLYAKRHCLDMSLGNAWQDVTWREGDVQKHDDQRGLGLRYMRAAVQMEIERLELRARANRAPALAQMTTTSPIMPTTGQIDASSRVYRGDPLVRR